MTGPSITAHRRDCASQTRAKTKSTAIQAHLECEELVTHLQSVAELKDTALSHELHDELGGLMGAAVMDLDAVRRVEPPLSQTALNRVDRVKRTLEQAIELKRRVTEELRPSILDNFGLFAALRWQFKKTWSNSDVVSTESYPNIEPRIEPHAAIALFRIAQEALSMALNRASVKSTNLTVVVNQDNFWMSFSDDGEPSAITQTEDPAIILASIKHRIRVLGGSVQISRTAGATVLTVSMPLQVVLVD
jgi:signal transduction histidine kinase